ncbi:MAG: hypothetical protein K0S27_1429 [Gammaproteobacteria bacterium]|nr:hypothetical protein [Gammaproteobacteria bacterium]
MLFSTFFCTVARYLSIKTGDLTPKVSSEKRPILNKENLPIIKSIYSSNKDSTLKDFCDEFIFYTDLPCLLIFDLRQTNVKLSKFSISRFTSDIALKAIESHFTKR